MSVNRKHLSLWSDRFRLQWCEIQETLYNTMSHNEQGITTGARRKHCRAFNVKCGKCKRKGHFTELCKAGQWGKKRDDKEAKVNVVNTTELVASDTSAAALVPPDSVAETGPVAALNSVQQVQREYVFR